MSDPPPVSLSVVIPTWNEAANIAAAVAEARRLQPLEILVADGGSGDATTELAAAAGATVVATASGRGTQQAEAAEAAAGDRLLFLHADCRFEADTADDALAAAVRDPAARWGGFRMRVPARGWAYRLVERAADRRVRRRGVVYGDQGLFVDRWLYEEVGGFERIPLMEDLRLSRRMRAVAAPVLRPERLVCSPRRWEREGVVRRTLRNQWLLFRERCGVPPDELVRGYRRETGE